MLAATPCIDAPDYERLVRGDSTPPEVEQVALHLESCPSCAARLQSLSGEDSLLQAARNASVLELSETEGVAVDRLVERLCRMRSQEKASNHEETGPESWAFSEPAQAPGELGRLGPYRALRLLGAGGMGVVFLAEDTQLCRPVALKTMKPGLASGDTARQRFLREARAAAALKHDHVVTIYQTAEHRGVPYLAMEFLEGQSLARRLEDGRRLPITEALRISREIAEGLAAAHARGLVHRDVKPENIWLESRPIATTNLRSAVDDRPPNGTESQQPRCASGVPDAEYRVKILDFGLARSSSDDGNLTQTGAVVGTPAYMSPEQARGGSVDASSDLFSLGCVLYRLLTDEHAFQGKDVNARLLSLVIDQPRPPRELNPDVRIGLSDLVMQLLAKLPSERPSSTRDVVEALKDFERATNGKQAESPAGSPACAPAAGTHALSSVLTEPLPKLSASFPRLRAAQPRRLAALAAVIAVFLGAALLAPQVIIRIKNKNGTVTEIRTDPDAVVEIVKDGKIGIPVTEDKKPDAVNIAPAPPGVKSGAPLSPQALVGSPAVLPGVQSWTLETNIHRGPTGALAYSPDGLQLATGDFFGTVRIWETANNRLLRVLIGHGGPIHRNALAWSPDGSYVASGSVDKTVRLWEVGSGRTMRVLKGHGRYVSTVAWSPDGKTLATGSADGTVRLWDAATGATLHTFEEDTQGVWQVAWSPGGEYLAVACNDGKARLREGKSGRLLQVLAGHAKSVEGVSWSPDGKTLATGSADHTVRLWEAATGHHLRTRELKEWESRSYFSSLAWAPKGNLLGVVSSQGELTLLDTDSGKALWNVQMDVLPSQLAWSPDGKTVADAYYGGVRLRTASTGDVRGNLPGLVTTQLLGRYPAWSPDGKMLAAKRNESVYYLWNAVSGQLLNSLDGPGSPNEAGWSPDGKTLAILRGGEVQLWETPSARLARTLPAEQMGNADSLAWSPDGKMLAVGGPENTIKLWKVTAEKPNLVLQGHTGIVRALAWAPDAKRLASAADDATVRLWDLESGKLQRKLQGHTANLVALLWSADGKTLASGGDDKTIRLWDAETGDQLDLLQGHTAPVRSLAWVPGGKTLVSYSIDESIRFWDVKAGRQVRSVSLSGRVDYCANFSPEARFLACHEPPQVRLWETETGRLRGVLLSLPDDKAIAVNADGHYQGSPRVERFLVYVVQTERGQETLTPEEFAQKYQWKNEPGRVRLTAE